MRNFGHPADELPSIREFFSRVLKRIRRQSLHKAVTDAQQREESKWNEKAQEAFENITRELCDAPKLYMTTEKGICFSGGHFRKMHQEQEWNGRTVLGLIAYGSKLLSDTGMKYGAPKAEIIAVVTPTWGVLPSICEWTTEPYPG